MIIKEINNKSVVWFSDTNEYIIVEPIIAKILSLKDNNIDDAIILDKISNLIDIPNNEATNLINDVGLLLNDFKSKEITTTNSASEPKEYFKTVFYSINNLIFKIDFASEYELSLVHPKFAHLVINEATNFDYNYKVFSNNEVISFSINNEIIGSWNLNEVHYFQGKFSMKITEHIHQKEEKEWLGVFHASAIGNGKNSMLFLGDSGNGKSTSLALLQANGFTCIADDFVPVKANNQEVYSFPSAISIKKNSLKTLIPIYPELENSAEYHFKRLNKIVRYLPPNNNNYTNHLPCKALIFIKYSANSDLQLKQISNIDAFQKLVPDSWLSPIQKNAEIFLDWFNNLPCYELTYSNNEKMIDSVHKIFNNEL